MLVRSKFTLIELLVAILIISVLVTIIATGSEFVTYKIKVSQTESQIQRLELALEKYFAEYDFYYIACDESGKAVTGEVEFNPDPLIIPSGKVLRFDYGMFRFCSRAENARSFKEQDYVPKTFLGDDYIHFKKSATDQLQRVMGLKDGWGNLLMYRFPGKHNTDKFDIWSRGPDGEGLHYTDSGQLEDDDITNWKLQK